MIDEVQVLRDVRQDLGALRRVLDEVTEDDRKDEFVRERHAGIEEHHRRHDQRHREFLLVLVETGRDEAPDLPEHIRDRDEEPDDARQFERRHERRHDAGRNELRARRQLRLDRQRDEVVDLVLEIEARRRADRDGDQAAHQPITELQQVGDQRAFGQLFFLCQIPRSCVCVMKSPGLSGGSSWSWAYCDFTGEGCGVLDSAPAVSAGGAPLAPAWAYAGG